MALKELRHITRDARSLGMALAIPVLMLMMFGLALSLDVDRIPTAIYDQSKTSESRALIERLRGSRYFEIQKYVNNYREIESLIDKSRVLIGFVIPADYAKDVGGGHEGQVQLLIDGSDSNTASIALGYAESVVRGYSLEMRREGQNRRGAAPAVAATPVDMRLRVWYNSELKSRNYIVPGLTAVILMIIAALLTSLTIAREWELGTMEQLLSTPLRPAEIVLGKMLAFFCVGVVDTAITMFIGIVVFDVPFRGNPLMVIVSSSVFLFGALFWGILISAITRNQLLAFQMGLLSSFLPAFLLSGFVYALEGMPLVPRLMSRIVPARYFITILKGTFLKGVGLSVLWPELLFLAIFATLVFVAATRKLRQKVA